VSRAARLLVVGVLVAAVVAVVTLPVADWALLLVERVRDAGLLGALAFALVYIVATVLLVPASLFTLAAGFLYGPWWGTLLVSPTSVTAATVAFLIARHGGRDLVERRIGGSARVSAIDRAVRDRGFTIVALLRLSPVLPFIIMNYVLGLTGVGLGRYVLGSFVGMLPATFLYVYLGSLITSVASLAEGAPGDGLRTTALWVGLAATVAITVLLMRIAKKALHAEAPGVEGPQ
jgi:uncharacterized membrane protein YdjX (TVP38/TMEM64 family)